LCSRSSLVKFEKDYPVRMDEPPQLFLPKFVGQLRRSMLHDLRAAGILMDMCRRTYMGVIDAAKVNNHAIRAYCVWLLGVMERDCEHIQHIKERQSLINEVYRLELDVFAPSAKQVEDGEKARARIARRLRRDAPDGVDQNWWTERFKALRKVNDRVEKSNEERKQSSGEGKREGHRRLLL